MSAAVTAAGLVYQSRDRNTYAIRSVYNAAAAGIDVDGAKYATVCERHGAIVAATSITAAKCSTLEFCQECREAFTPAGDVVEPEPASAEPVMFDLPSIAPSPEQWERNASMGTGEAHCMVCNRRMNDRADGLWWVHYSVDGELFPAQGEHDDHPATQGWFAIGNECAKKIPLAYRNRSAVAA